MNANERGSRIVEEGRGRQVALGDSIRDNLNGEALGVANRFFARLAVAHDGWKFQCFGNRRKLRGLTTRAQDAILPYNQTDPLPEL